MKLSHAETFTVDGGTTRYHFLKLTTADGLAGWSEFSDPGPAPAALAGIVGALAERIMGADPRDPRRISADLKAAARINGGGLYGHAIAAIENACLDLSARALGIPVYRLLGGGLRAEIPLYWSHCGMYRSRAPFCEATGLAQLRSLDDVERLGAEVRERGYRALKTNIIRFRGDAGSTHYPGIAPVGAGPALNASPELLRDTVDLMAAFRRGAGADVELMIDANFNFRADGFVALARALEPLGLAWLECDLPDPATLAALRQASATPIGSLETVLTPREFAPFMAARAVDVAIIDVMWCGMLASLEMAQLAAAHETSVATHGYTGPLATAMCAHFAALLPNLRVMEYDVDAHPLRDIFVLSNPPIENGNYLLGDAPGWGVEMDEAAIRRHQMA